MIDVCYWHTEAAVPCCRGKRCELRVAHVNQRLVVSALEIDLRLLFDAVIDNGIEAVAFANWRNSAGHHDGFSNPAGRLRPGRPRQYASLTSLVRAPR
jgi:hypothetical protein